MRLLGSILVLGMVLQARQALAGVRRTTPVNPTVICTTADGNWEFKIFGTIGQVKVYDMKQGSLSVSRRGLIYADNNKIVTLSNDGTEADNFDLLKGVILQADLNQSGVNGYLINDLAGTQINISCAYPLSFKESAWRNSIIFYSSQRLGCRTSLLQQSTELGPRSHLGRKGQGTQRSLS